MLRRTAIAALVLGTASIASAQLAYVPHAHARFISSDGTGNPGTWTAATGGIAAFALPFVPADQAGDYCSFDGSGHIGTWAPCPVSSNTTGGASTPNTTLPLCGNGSANGVKPCTAGTDYAAPASTVPITAPNIARSILDDGTVKGNGTTADGTAIATLLTNNPTRDFRFPTATYLLNNSAGATGLNIPAAYSGKLTFEAGAKLTCNTATTSAGACVVVATGSTNLQAVDLDIAYVGQSATAAPLTRANSTQFAFVTSGTANGLKLINPTVESSTGPCIWITNSVGVTVQNAKVSNCTADGIHFENDSSVTLDGLWTTNTLDDALGTTNLSSSSGLCGGSFSNIHILNGYARGISVIGSCNYQFSNFEITNTGAAGILVASQTSYRRPANIHFVNGIITNGSSLAPSSGVADQNGLEVGAADYVKFSNVKVMTQTGNGVYISASPTHLSYSNITIESPTGSGFQVVTGSQIDVSNVRVDKSPSYSFFIGQASDFTGSQLTSYDAYYGTTGALDRALWVSTSAGPVSVNGLNVYDDQATPTGNVVGGDTNTGYPVLVSGINGNVTHGKLSVQPGSTEQFVASTSGASFSSTTITAAATIAPVDEVSVVSGSTAISTITVPAFCSSSNACRIQLVGLSAFSLTTGGNIAVPASIALENSISLTYLPSYAIWVHQ